MLYLSSPIGLGHARRDIAIAAELRALRPDVRGRLAGPAAGDRRCWPRAARRIHPASALLASESAHWESEADEHDLHAFQALRRMDEILVANFMVFADLVEAEHYDLWVGDEAWEVDYFLHENPELKRAPYVWLTDFVGFLPMPDGGAGRGRADRRLQRRDDRADRPVPAAARPGAVRRRPGGRRPGRRSVPDLPAIRDWTEEHYDFTGYITGFDPAEIADRAALRAEFGWAPDERVCLVTVGGSGVGEHLLRRAIAAFPQAAAAGARAAHDRGHRPADRPGVAGPRAPGLECTRTCPTCTGAWRPAIWPWCRAA